MEETIFLIGDVSENVCGRKLPTVRELMSVFFYEHNFCGFAIKKSARNTINKIQSHWSRAGIPTCGIEYAIKKLLAIHRNWRTLKKSRHRKKSTVQFMKTSNLKITMLELFDIAKPGVEKLLNDEQKLFLLDKKKGPTQCNKRKRPIHVLQKDIHLMDVDNGRYLIH